MIIKKEKIDTNEKENSETYLIEIDNKNTYKVKFILGENSIQNILTFISLTKKE